MQERHLRAQTYKLLARLLINPPDSELLAVLADLNPDPVETALSRSWQALSKAAKACDEARLRAEFQQLFIGLGRGEVLPFASYYLSGYLMEKPLAALRQDLKALGFQRRTSNKEPEDHISAICEVMAFLVMDQHVSESAFFQHHVVTWFDRFFEDLRGAPSAAFYEPVGQLGHAFVDFERSYLLAEVDR
ncbi:MAG: TorD/DmsD family molecular chaperone [Gammaproteobacteria bacterium]